MNHFKLLLPFVILLVQLSFFASCNGGNSDKRPRVIVSTDIGGTDFDDYQSMVHLLVYADTFDIEGIISSPYGEGGIDHIHKAIDLYEIDYLNLKKYSGNYPTPNALRKIVKQGATDTPGPVGYSKSTEGSNWIIDCAMRDDSRPLNVLIWGGIEDLAQALHDAPDILPKLRVYFIGGPNKKWSVASYQYITQNYPELWIIESNATYRGWFVGGNQKGEWSNKEFVKKHVKDFGALGEYFYAHGTEMKMGDTPSLIYFLSNNPEDPTQPNWGGQYVRAWDRPHKVFNQITSVADSIEEFGVLELILPFETEIKNPFAVMHIENQSIKAELKENRARFLFSPKRSGHWNYSIESNIVDLNKMKGQLVSYPTPPSNKENPSEKYPNWWVDDPSPKYVENGHIGAKTVNRWREDFLRDFAKRMKRCSSPAKY